MPTQSVDTTIIPHQHFHLHQSDRYSYQKESHSGILNRKIIGITVRCRVKQWCALRQLFSIARPHCHDANGCCNYVFPWIISISSYQYKARTILLHSHTEIITTVPQSSAWLTTLDCDITVVGTICDAAQWTRTADIKTAVWVGSTTEILQPNGLRAVSRSGEQSKHLHFDHSF